MPDFLDAGSYFPGELSVVILQSAAIAFIFSLLTGLMAYRAALRKQSRVFFWLGNFATTYAFWNIFYLFAYGHRDIQILNVSLTIEVVRRAHLILSLLLPIFAHRFLSLFF